MNTLILFILVIIAAVSNAVMDKIKSHHSHSVFKNLSDFWNPATSWRYKWADGSTTEERFWLSSTVLVFTTDAWHLAQFIMLKAFFILPFIYEPITNYWFIDFVILHTIFSGVFEICFTYVFEKK